jgi:glycosyltransferase involved in cell wall biosynthesis
VKEPKVKLVIIQRVFSNYRKAIFDALSEKYDMTLLHSVNKSGISQIKTIYSKKVKSFNYWRKETNVFLCVLPTIFKNKPVIIIHEFNPSIISLHLSFLFAKIFNRKFIIWGHGYNRRTGFEPKSSFVSNIRYWYMKNADAILVYGQKGKKELGQFVDTNKIFVAQNTLDTNFLIGLRKEFEGRGIEAIKKELGITHKYNLVFIGRLLKEKHPEFLLELYESFEPSLRKDIAIRIIGDGKMYEALHESIAAKKLEKNIFLLGKIDDDSLNGKYLYVSDLTVNPGFLGLSVNHSFCFNTPMVSFEEGINGPFHSPEIEYLIQNKTGYLAKNGNIEDMVNFIVNYLHNSELQNLMKKEIENCVTSRCSISNMEKGFVDAINYCMRDEKG